MNSNQFVHHCLPCVYVLLMSASILKYGQIIRIRADEFANCFLTSKSYTDQNVYFQIYNKEDTFLSGGQDIINISNYREALFEVLPTSSFEINDEMNSQKDEAKKAESAPRAKTEADQFTAMIAEKRGKYISFGAKVIFRHVDSGYYLYGSWDCASSGIGAFKIELKKELSEKIIFQLMSYRTYEKDSDEMSIYAPFKIFHCETQCYVSYCYERMFLDSGNRLNARRLKFSLNAIESPTVKQCYYKEGDQEVEQPPDEVSPSRRKEILPNTGRFLMINQNIHRRVFKLVIHNEFEMKVNKVRIRNHDIVYFIHTQKDQYVCPSTSKPQVFLKKRKEETDLADIFDGLWEIEEIKMFDEKSDDLALGKSKSPSRKDKQPKKLGNLLNLPGAGTGANLGVSYLAATVGAPLTEGQLGAGFHGGGADVDEQVEKGGKKKEKYILRHLCSGRIMYVSDDLRRVDLQEFQSTHKKPILLQSVDSKLEDGALVQFSHKTKDMTGPSVKFTKRFLGVVSKDEALRKAAFEGIIKEVHEYEDGQSFEEEEEDINYSKNLVDAYKEKFDVDKLGLTLDSSEHGFRIYKVAEEIKQLCLFVLSSQQILSKFTQLIEDYASLDELVKDLKVPLLNNVINVLKNLIGFIYDCDYNRIAQSGNNPNSKKQRIFDELGMIELVTRMLEQINRRDFPPPEEPNRLERLGRLQELGKNSEYRKVRTVYELGYKLLQSVAAGNDLMKVKISKYLKHYLSHILEKANRTVYRSIQEFLDGNYLALGEIEDDFIKDLISHLDKADPDPADLYFLSRLCLCREKTVTKNQVGVFSNFYSTNEEGDFSKFSKEGDQDLDANQFRFREDQSKMQIFSRIIPTVEPQYRTLSQLYEQCNLMKSEGGYDPDKNHWSYFMQYLNLLADICVQRNEKPLEYIKKNLPLKTLVAFLHQNTVKKNLLFQPFIRLVHHAFVETSAYEEINRITKVKEWDGLGNFNIPRAKNPIPFDLKKTMDLIIDYIKRINRKDFERKPEILNFLREQEEQKKKGKSKDKDKDKEKKEESELKQPAPVVEQMSGSAAEPDTIDFNVDDRDRLINVKTFLEIMKSTLNLGFWPQIDQMKKMVPYLLKVMRFDIEYADRVLQQVMISDKKAGINQHLEPKQYKELVYALIKQQMKLNKPNILLLVECKVLAAKILNIIIDYEYNLRVSIITKYFKDVMDIDVNLSKYKYDKMEFIHKWKQHVEYRMFEPANEKEGYLLIEELWKDKVCEIIAERDIFSQCISEGINPALVFFETFVYSNTELTNLTLELMNRVTNQRTQILRTFKDIIFVAGGHLKKLATRGVQTTRSVLLNLCSPNVREQSQLNNFLWIKMRPGEQRLQNLKLGVVQELASLTMSMMKSRANPTPMDASNFYTDTDLYPYCEIMSVLRDTKEELPDGSYIIITEKDENLELNQNLIKSQDHHLLIIDFLRIMRELPTNHYLPMRALHAAYNFLSVLVWNNKENKKQLENVLKLGECHLPYNVGCIDFFKQMYTNNMKLVKKSQVKPIIKTVIEHANKLPMSSYLKSKLLDFMRIVVIFDDQGYQINQNIVMEEVSQCQVSSDNQVVYLKAEEQANNSLSNQINRFYGIWIKEYMKQYRTATYEQTTINVSPELFYVATFFEVFSALIDNQNVVNIGKASNMHPIDFLLNLLKQSERCWVVIRHLRCYLNRLYYFDKRSKDSVLYNIFINEDLAIIKEELLGIVELVCNSSHYNIINIKNPVRYCYLGSYVFLSLEEIMHSLNLFFKEKPEDKSFENYLTLILAQAAQDTTLTYTILQIIEMLEYLLKTIDGRYINKYMMSVSKRLRGFVANTPYRVVKQYEEDSKARTNKNIEMYKIGNDDIAFKKSYGFHDGKGFWRHFIDWNSFKDQEEERDIMENKVMKRVEPIPGETKEALEQRERDYLLDKIFLGKIDKRVQKNKSKPPPKGLQTLQKKGEEEDKAQAVLPKNLQPSHSNRFKVKRQNFESASNKNITINERRQKLVKFLEVNDEFQKFGSNEVHKQLYDVFAGLDGTSMQRYKQLVVVGNADVIKSIVKMNEYDPQSIKYEYKLILIRLLTNYIQRQSNVFGGQIQTWGINCIEDSAAIAEAQNFLYDCGVASFLSSLIINDLNNSIEMANAILMLGISLLLNKNKNNQNELFKLICQDERNLVLTKVCQLIKDCGAFIAAHRLTPPEQVYNETGIKYSDTYDFYIDTERIMDRKFVYQPQTVLQQKEFQEKVVNMQYAFILLKNLCEGNVEIKEYIREQVSSDEEKKPKADSVDFLSLGVSQLKRMFNNFNIKIIKVPFSIIDFVYEVTQIPCLQNQRSLCRSSLFSDFAALEMHISEVLSEKGPIEVNQKNILIIFNLYSSNIKNVNSCLQGNRTELYELLSSEVLCRYFVRVLAFYIRYLPVVERVGEITCGHDLEVLLNKKKLHESYYLDMFQVTAVIIKLSKKTPVQQFDDRIYFSLKKTAGMNMFEIFELLKKNLLGIEIRMDGDQLQTLFFPKHKVFTYLSRVTRVNIMEQVDRSTQRDKIIGLLGTKDAITQEIDYNYSLDNQFTIFKVPFSITTAKIDYYFNLGLKIASLICFLVAYFAAVVYYPYEEAIEYDMGAQTALLKGLSLVQFIVSLSYFLLWLKTHLHLAIQKYERDKSAAMEQNPDQPFESAITMFLFKIPGFKSAYCLTNDGEFGNMALFMFGSAMGMFYRIEWFSILLMNLLMARLDVLKNILQALKASLPMLGMLSFFGASFIAFFSVFSLYYYADSIYPDKFPKEHCESVTSCIVQLYIKEEIGNDMEVFETGRFMYDMIYVVFMDMLFGNIVGGVLIDNFASLRGEREEMLKDKTEKCFICGIDRETLEKKSLTLKTHYTQQYHKLWNYVFYLYHLEKQTKKTGLEEIIVRKFEGEDVSWLPLATSEEDGIGDLLKKLEDLMREQESSLKVIELKE